MHVLTSVCLPLWFLDWKSRVSACESAVNHSFCCNSYKFAAGSTIFSSNLSFKKYCNTLISSLLTYLYTEITLTQLRLRQTTQSKSTHLTAGTTLWLGEVCVCYDCVLTCLIPVTLGRFCKQDGATRWSLLGKYNFTLSVTQFKWVKSPKIAHKSNNLASFTVQSFCLGLLLMFKCFHLPPN